MCFRWFSEPVSDEGWLRFLQPVKRATWELFSQVVFLTDWKVVRRRNGQRFLLRFHNKNRLYVTNVTYEKESYEIN
jgi:hypothetical protein